MPSQDLLTVVRARARSLRRSASFTVVAVASIAIGVGVNAAVFAAANGMLLHGLPYADADRIVAIWQRSPGIDVKQDWLSTAQVFDIAAETSVFERTATAIGASFNLVTPGGAERLDGVRVSSSFFPLFGARAVLGRVFDASDDTPGKPPRALLTYGFWMRRFAGDPSIVGKPLSLNGTPVTVVGVLSPGFSLSRNVMFAVNGIERTDVVMPLPLPPSARDNRGGEDFNLFAKLKRGVSIDAAQRQLNEVAVRMRETHPEVYPAAGQLGLIAVALVDQVLGDAKLVLYLLVGAAAIVALVACANIANLMLSRSMTNEHELAIRAAVGANAWRLVQVPVVDSALIAVMGAIAGLGLASLAIAVLRNLEGSFIPRAPDLRIDAGVGVFTVGLTLTILAAIAIPSARRARNTDVTSALRNGARGATTALRAGGHRGWMSRSLIACEVALCVVLITGAGLLLRSYVKIRGANPGFDVENLLTFRLTLPGAKYKTREAVSQFYRDLAGRLRALPGVDVVGMNYQLPLSSVALAWEPIMVDGYTPKGPGGDRITASSAYVTPDYFRAMGIRVSRGRPFIDSDGAGAPPVVIVDDRLAARFWPHGDAVGKRIRQGTDGPWRTIVGVVSDGRTFEAQAQPAITAYFPIEQFSIGSRFVVLRTNGLQTPEQLMREVRQRLREIDAEVPPYDVAPMARRFSDSVATRRLFMNLMLTFAALALLLSLIGTFGVIAYWVSERRRDLGIRIVLGAGTARVAGTLTAEFGTAIGAGAILGLFLSLAGTRVLSTVLFGIRPNDFPSYAAAVIAVILLAAAAILIHTLLITRARLAVILGAT